MGEFGAFLNDGEMYGVGNNEKTRSECNVLLLYINLDQTRCLNSHGANMPTDAILGQSLTILKLP